MVSTTRASIYADNANRSIELVADESEAQDEQVLERQRALAAGLVDIPLEEATREKLRNVQRILRPCPVRNPYAPKLSLPKEVFHRRRTNALFLGLIQAITLLHQYQRQKTIGPDGRAHLVTEQADIQWAERLFGQALLHKADLLTQSTRGFFEALKSWTKEQGLADFTQRQVASGMRLHPVRVKRGMHELMDYGLISITGGDRYRKGFTYSVTDAGEFDRLRKRVLPSSPAPTKGRKKQWVGGSSVGRSQATH
jgi:hypothetical protein